MKSYNISGIGNHCIVKTPGDGIQWRIPAKPIETEFYLLDGKIVEMEACSGQLTKISEDEKFGILSTDICLQPLQDIMIRTGEQDLYAKTVCREEDGYRIGFTIKEGNLV